jgi:DHA1 family bicyclomycin/chloramphenicol resistance-like MFS transporter
MSRQPGPGFAVALASISLIGPLAIHIYLPLLPAVKADLGLSDAMAQATFSVALVAMAVSTLFWGPASDRFGRRPALLSGLAIFLLGSIACAFAGSIETLVLGRLLQAFGAGAGAALVRAIARDAYGAEQLVKAIAYLTMFYTLGPMVSPMIGGALVDAFGWRSVFGFSVAAGLVISVSAYFVVFETRPRPVTGAFRPGAVADFRALFSHLRFTCFVLQTGFNTAAFFVAASAASFLMTETLGRPSAEFGLWFVLFPIGFFVGNFVASRVGGRATNETMVLVGSVLAFVAVAMQSGLLLSGWLTPLAIFGPGFLITLAQGVSLPYAQGGAISTIPRIAGTAAGVGLFVQNFMGALFTQFYGFIADGGIVPLTIAAGLAALLGLLVSIPPMLARKA